MKPVSVLHIWWSHVNHKPSMNALCLNGESLHVKIPVPLHNINHCHRKTTAKRLNISATRLTSKYFLCFCSNMFGLSTYLCFR